MARDYKARHKAAQPRRHFPVGPAFPAGWVSLAASASGSRSPRFVYLKDHRHRRAGGPRRQAGQEEIPARTIPPDADGGDAGSPRRSPLKSYAFYDMLPKFEVVVPEKEKDVRPDVRAVPETRRGTYVLQAGSYKNFADADRVRAKLALQGIESKVQKVSVDNDTWHRIRIGPISKSGRAQPPARHPAQGRRRRAGDPGRRLSSHSRLIVA